MGPEPNDTLVDDKDFMLLFLFVCEAKKKTNQMQILWNKLDEDMKDKKSEQVFTILQSILLFSAQVSFIFHSKESRETKRRSERLRAAFGIDQAIDFLSDRGFRDNIAHMDERLHTWRKQSPNGIFVRELIGPRGSVGGDAISSQDIFEQYIPDERIYIFMGKEFDLKKLFAAINLINLRATAMCEHPFWAPGFKRLFRP